MLSKELKSQGIKTVPWLRCDGGVTHNTVVCQSIADIADVDLEVPSDRDMSSLGTAYMSGLQAGLWSKFVWQLLGRVW
jgi:glycerol kinase